MRDGILAATCIEGQVRRMGKEPDVGVMVYDIYIAHGAGIDLSDVELMRQMFGLLTRPSTL